MTDAGAVAAAFSGPQDPPRTAAATVDAVAWTVEEGAGGDLRMTYGDRAAMHLDAGATRLLCHPADPADLRWQRVLLDSALVTASLQRGNEALHAGAVVIGGRAVAIAGPSGAGKTTLIAELVARGHPLLTDDILFLTRNGDGVLAHPGPPLMNLPSDRTGDGHEVLGVIDGESWVAVAGAARAAVPLGGVFVLTRRPGAITAIEELPDPSAVLLALGLNSGSAPERAVARLDLLAAVAAAAPVRHLLADSATPVTDLANLIESRAVAPPD